LLLLGEHELYEVLLLLLLLLLVLDMWVQGLLIRFVLQDDALLDVRAEDGAAAHEVHEMFLHLGGGGLPLSLCWRSLVVLQDKLRSLKLSLQERTLLLRQEVLPHQFKQRGLRERTQKIRWHRCRPATSWHSRRQHWPE
jgi:hypothetical protein